MTKYINPPKSSDCKWRSGPPPSIGWWPASAAFDPQNIRWWNGEYWSVGVRDSDDSGVAEAHAKTRTAFFNTSEIQWTDRWWEKGQA